MAVVPEQLIPVKNLGSFNEPMGVRPDAKIGLEPDARAERPSPSAMVGEHSW